MEIPWEFLNSPFLQALLTFSGAIFVASIGIGNFYAQQRTARLQKIYFEDSVLSLLEEVDSAILTSRQNAYIGSNALDLVFNFIKRTHVDQPTLIKYLENLIVSLKPPGQIGDVKKEIMPDLFGPKGNILSQWLYKAEVDLNTFYSVVMGGLLLILNSLQLPGQRIKKNDEEMLTKIHETIRDHNLRIQRHAMLLFFLSKLVAAVGTTDFKNKKDLGNIKNRKEIRILLEKIEVSFKMLFGFYKTNDTTFYSYTKDEDGKNFKIKISGPDSVQISREKLEDKLPEAPYLVIDDTLLLGGKIVDDKELQIPLFEALMGMTNMYVFDEKPHMLPSLESFGRSRPF